MAKIRGYYTEWAISFSETAGHMGMLHIMVSHFG